VENYGQGLSFDGIHPSPTGYALMTTKVVADVTDRKGQVRYPRVVHLATPCVLRSIAYQDSPVVSHVGVVFIRARTLFFNSSEMTSWGYSAAAGVYVCVLALALVPGTVPNRVGRISLLRFFGRYSYGLYVWHQLPAPICIPWQGLFTRHIHPLILGQVAYATAMLAVFTALAFASYHLLELRFLRLKSRFRYAEFK
jgi:peptidoglycan/LPS O-acetylase OafA/YrhL